MKKQFVLPALFLALALTACRQQPPVDGTAPTGDSTAPEQNIDLPPDDAPPAMQQTSSAAAPAAPAPSSKAAVTPPATGGSRTITMTVMNFKFSPAQITVKKGEKIKLQVTGTEGTHGLAIPDLGVNISVSPGQTVTIDIPTTKAGTFAFFCSIPCGPGHRDMRGTIVITE